MRTVTDCNMESPPTLNWDIEISLAHVFDLDPATPILIFPCQTYSVSNENIGILNQIGEACVYEISCCPNALVTKVTSTLSSQCFGKNAQFCTGFIFFFGGGALMHGTDFFFIMHVQHDHDDQCLHQDFKTSSFNSQETQKTPQGDRFSKRKVQLAETTIDGSLKVWTCARICLLLQ